MTYGICHRSFCLCDRELRARLTVTKTVSIARMSGVQGNYTVASYSGPGERKVRFECSQLQGEMKGEVAKEVLSNSLRSDFERIKIRGLF